jgi:UPF0176 protein
MTLISNNPICDEEASVIVTAFYHFAHLDDYESLKDPLLRFCLEQGLKGTILLAKEGINSTISGSREGVDALYSYLYADIRLANLTYKESRHYTQPFQKMKVRLKKEIVAMGVEDVDVFRYRGHYVEPHDWDAFISRSDVVLVDTRNMYEYKMGYFEGAIDPGTNNFREFPEWVDQFVEQYPNKKIAMYCTGGIRCEKSTAYLVQKGFVEVYHLKGGILQYFEDTANKNNKWHGDCFVFDDRAVVDANLHASNNTHCAQCGILMTTDDIKHSPNRSLICVSCALPDKD